MHCRGLHQLWVSSWTKIALFFTRAFVKPEMSAYVTCNIRQVIWHYNKYIHVVYASASEVTEPRITTKIALLTISVAPIQCVGGACQMWGKWLINCVYFHNSEIQLTHCCQNLVIITMLVNIKCTVIWNQYMFHLRYGNIVPGFGVICVYKWTNVRWNWEWLVKHGSDVWGPYWK